MVSIPFSYETSKGTKIMSGAYDFSTDLESTSAYNKMAEWANEENISLGLFGTTTNPAYAKFGTAWGDDSIGNLIMHTPLVSKDFPFTKWVGISTEGSIQFFNKEITSFSNTSYDSGFSRSYVNGSFYPVISFDFEGSNGTDTKIFDSRYYSDENVTLIWIYYGQYNNSANRFPVAIRIKRNKIEFYFSGYGLNSSDTKATSMPFYINTWENGSNKRYVLQTLSGYTNYLSFKLCGSVDVEYAESDDGITFGPYTLFNSSKLPQKRFLKFRAIIDGGTESGEKKVFEFDQKNPETKLVLNKFLSSVGSDVKVNAIHKIDGIKNDNYTDGVLFEIPIDRTKYKSITKIEVV
ncbi:hypothetical protein M3Y14_33670 (plasmid) [Bacillus thuringiensis]|uniref:hypothetical protein n=1 Tax=Bacillus thuringiensis TaxID=1428 RepID=UPI002225A6FE|nr:hypothetical protein [Bacillus thuringiensis]UYX56202.1 hypothetical protein M3Y14_33670 [Bacillus thuringiensis]